MKNILYIIKNTLNFQGHDDRKVYWTYILFYSIIKIALSSSAALYTGYYNDHNNLEPDGMLFDTETFIINAIIFIPLISATVRRIRDAGFSPWFSLIPMGNLIFAAFPSKNQLSEVSK